MPNIKLEKNYPISMKVLFFAAVSILFGVLGQLFFKAAALQFSDGSIKSIDVFFLLSHYYLIAGISFYLLALIIWLYVLKELPLSIAYPLLSVNYIFVYIGAVNWSVINEEAKLTNIIGTLLVMLGLTLVVYPKKAEMLGKLSYE